MTTVRRPIFRARGEPMVATTRIKIVEGTFIEPGELIPEGIRRATLRRWFLRRAIGPVGSGWTKQLLERRQKLLGRDKAAKRLHPGGEAELVRIAAAIAGKVEPSKFKPKPRASTAIDKGAAGARKNGGAASGAGTSKTTAKRDRKGAASAPPPSTAPAAGATFGDGSAPQAPELVVDTPPAGDVAPESLTGDAELDAMLAEEEAAAGDELATDETTELEPLPEGSDVHGDEAEPDAKS